MVKVLLMSASIIGGMFEYQLGNMVFPWAMTSCVIRDYVHLAMNECQ